MFLPAFLVSRRKFSFSSLFLFPVLLLLMRRAPDCIVQNSPPKVHRFPGGYIPSLIDCVVQNPFLSARMYPDAYNFVVQEQELELIVEEDPHDNEDECMDEVYDNMVNSLLEDADAPYAESEARQAAAPPQEANFPTEANENEPASPIRTQWPADSLLKPEHFTIETQRCLNCNANLGYAMPMNRLPKVKYLFCDHPNCQSTNFLKCFACGNFQSESTGHLVYRPGNSAYTGPSQIYSFMCTYCYKDQMSLEPGPEETKEQYKKFAAVRKENEQKEFGRLLQAQAASDMGVATLKEQQQQLPFSAATRKRRRTETEGEIEA